MPEHVPETFLGQIRLDGKWVDYARGHEAPSRTWQAGDPANRRVVDWISREVLIAGHPEPVTHVEVDGVIVAKTRRIQA